MSKDATPISLKAVVQRMPVPIGDHLRSLADEGVSNLAQLAFIGGIIRIGTTDAAGVQFSYQEVVLFGTTRPIPIEEYLGNTSMIRARCHPFRSAGFWAVRSIQFQSRLGYVVGVDRSHIQRLGNLEHIGFR